MLLLVPDLRTGRPEDELHATHRMQVPPFVGDTTEDLFGHKGPDRRLHRSTGQSDLRDSLLEPDEGLVDIGDVGRAPETILV